MATQLSAVTMIGTTGQGATDGMRFVQFYFGLPLAMVILGVTLVPFLHGAKVFTAYEFLERRFDAKTRSLTAFLFLLSRGMSCGTIIAAPAVVFSAIFGWPLGWCVALIGVPTVLYTMIGGVQAVTWADVKQMVLDRRRARRGRHHAARADPRVARRGAAHRRRGGPAAACSTSRSSLTNTYTFWSGIIGGTFLMLSYFGTDQSQVQRYLTASSVDEARSSLLISAYWKIPLQALVLLVGVLVFVFYQFERPPLLFNPAHERARAGGASRRRTRRSQRATTPRSPRARQPPRALPAPTTRDDRRAAAVAHVPRARDSRRQRARRGARPRRRVTRRSRRRDVNYIIPRFVLEQLPLGLAGLFIAGVIAAAMSAIAAELNSLVDGDGRSTSTAAGCGPRRPTRTSSACRRSRPAFWGSSPASSRRTPRPSAR